MRLNTSLLCLLILLGYSTANSQSFVSSNLPIFKIDTHGRSIVDDPKTVVDLEIIYNGPGQRNFLTDTERHFAGKIAIEIRGSSSQMFPKKQYGFELVDGNGVEYDTSLLGLPSESDWVLFAPYNDKSLMRDVLAYELASRQGGYAPRTRYCEVVLNGEYWGIYVLIEKIKRDKNRVDIDKLDPDDNSGDDVTGGYIVKIDKQTGDTDTGWFSEYPPFNANGNQRTNFLFEYPDPEDITSAQRTYITKFIQDFETVLISSDFADPIDGYARFVDMGSFVDFMIINEVSKNVDGYRLSTYFHKERNSDGGKLTMGPVWDFNLSFGNANYCTSGTTQGLVLDFNKICPADWWLIPFWWDRMLKDPTFSRELQSRWFELRENSFSTPSILNYIDSVSTVLNESQQRNFSRWPVLGVHLWPNYYVGNTYQDEVNWMKEWVTDRMTWLDIYMEGVVTENENNPGLVRHPFPNPSSESFNFQVAASGSPVNIRIYDQLGRVVEDLDISPVSVAKTVQAGSSLSPGHYYYNISVKGKRLGSGKLLKK